ncbi:hypothetical protein L209DRAFT_397950, partial [Thermothelomyces heterothallicus CBS 203.75]
MLLGDMFSFLLPVKRSRKVEAGTLKSFAACQILWTCLTFRTLMARAIIDTPRFACSIRRSAIVTIVFGDDKP